MCMCFIFQSRTVFSERIYHASDSHTFILFQKCVVPSILVGPSRLWRASISWSFFFFLSSFFFLFFFSQLKNSLLNFKIPDPSIVTFQTSTILHVWFPSPQSGGTVFVVCLWSCSGLCHLKSFLRNVALFKSRCHFSFIQARQNVVA